MDLLPCPPSQDPTSSMIVSRLVNGELVTLKEESLDFNEEQAVHWAQKALAYAASLYLDPAQERAVYEVMVKPPFIKYTASMSCYKVLLRQLDKLAKQRLKYSCVEDAWAASEVVSFPNMVSIWVVMCRTGWVFPLRFKRAIDAAGLADFIARPNGHRVLPRWYGVCQRLFDPTGPSTEIMNEFQLEWDLVVRAASRIPMTMVKKCKNSRRDDFRFEYIDPAQYGLAHAKLRQEKGGELSKIRDRIARLLQAADGPGDQSSVTESWLAETSVSLPADPGDSESLQSKPPRTKRATRSRPNGDESRDRKRRKEMTGDQDEDVDIKIEGCANEEQETEYSMVEEAIPSRGAPAGESLVVDHEEEANVLLEKGHKVKQENEDKIVVQDIPPDATHKDMTKEAIIKMEECPNAEQAKKHSTGEEALLVRSGLGQCFVEETETKGQSRLEQETEDEEHLLEEPALFNETGPGVFHEPLDFPSLASSSLRDTTNKDSTPDDASVVQFMLKMEKENTKLRRANWRYAQEKSRTELGPRAFRDDIVELRSRNTSLKAELQKLQQQVREGQNFGLSDKYQALLSENVRLRTENKELQTENEYLQQEAQTAQSLKTANNSLQTEALDLLAEARTLRAEKEALKSDIWGLELRNDGMESTLDRRVREKQLEVEARENTIQALKRENEALFTGNMNLQTEKGELTLTLYSINDTLWKMAVAEYGVKLAGWSNRPGYVLFWVKGVLVECPCEVKDGSVLATVTVGDSVPISITTTVATSAVGMATPDGPNGVQSNESVQESPQASAVDASGRAVELSELHRDEVTQESFSPTVDIKEERFDSDGMSDGESDGESDGLKRGGLVQGSPQVAVDVKKEEPNLDADGMDLGEFAQISPTIPANDEIENKNN